MLGDAGQFLLLIMGDGCQQAPEAEQEESDLISPTLHIMGILSFQGRHLREESNLQGSRRPGPCNGTLARADWWVENGLTASSEHL
jgi:hypothetical protein